VRDQQFVAFLACGWQSFRKN